MASISEKSCLHVLVVDDDACSLEISKQVLELENNFEIDSASSVDEAFRKMEKQTYDAIVSDYEMPLKNGIDFLKELKQQKREIPFVLFTGKGREEVAIRALNLGADQYIDKHGDPETVYHELAHSIRFSVERKKTMAALWTERNRLETVTRNIGAGIAIISKDYRTLWMNDVLKQIFGDAEGKICYLTYNQRNDICSGCGVHEIFENGKNKVVHEQVGKGVDGKTVWSEITATPVKDRGGNITAVLELVVPITQRKRAEEELHDYAARTRALGEELQTILDSLPMQIWYKDKDNQFVRVNKRFAEYMGVSKKDLEGRSLGDLYPPDTALKCWEEDREVIETGQPKIDILDHHESAQGLRWFLTSKMPYKSADEKIIGTINFSIDITERKKTEESLEKEQQELNRIIDSSPIIIFYKDKVGNLMRVNEAFAKALKIPKEKFLGKTVFDLYSAEIARGMANDDLEVLKSRRPKLGIIEQYESASGIRWVQTDKVPILDKNGISTGLIGFAQDITERKKAEEALRQSQTKFRMYVENSPVAVFVANTEGKYEFVNEAASKLLGYSAKELLRMSIPQVVFKEEHPILNSLAVLQETGEVSMEVRLKKKDSQAVYVDLNAVKLPDGKLIAFCENITERKKAEEALNRMMDELVLVNEKLNVVGSLTRHDIRNKLLEVTGNAFLLRKKHAGHADVIDRLGKIEQACKEIGEILDFAKMYEQLGVEKLSFIDAGKTLDEAVALSSGALDMKVTNDCHGLNLFADSFLRQLFYNLIDNSVRHGKKVTKIKVHYEKADQDGLNLIYEDDGVGISADDKLQIFKEGFSTGGSLGYGLYLIRKMIEVFGWTIHENGLPGKGAKFTIAIPRINQSGKENFQIAR